MGAKEKRQNIVPRTRYTGLIGFLVVEKVSEFETDVTKYIITFHWNVFLEDIVPLSCNGTAKLNKMYPMGYIHIQNKYFWAVAVPSTCDQIKTQKNQ